MSTRTALATLAVVTFAQPLAAQNSGAFLVRLGNDTVSVESWVRKPRQLEIYQVSRAPRTALRHFVVEFGRSGAVTRAEVATYRPPALDHPTQLVTVTFRGDSSTWVTRRGDSTVRRTVAAPARSVPLFVPPYAALSLVTEEAWRAGSESLSVLAQPSAGPPLPVPVTRVGNDTMVVDLPFGPVRARVSRGGRFLGSVAPDATAHHVVSPLGRVNVRALAVAFAARDSAGQGLGVLSPRDTVRAVIGGANLMVDYGRPMKRGREIFGGIVPWGKVWRTGANAATQLRTDRDLVIGGVTVPAGTYTLWTIPDQTLWKLIINKQTGQWGTEYHPEQDLARIDMQAAAAASPVERFTIEVVPEGSGGQLLLTWDRTVASLRFSVR